MDLETMYKHICYDKKLRFGDFEIDEDYLNKYPIFNF